MILLVEKLHNALKQGLGKTEEVLAVSDTRAKRQLHV